MTLTVYVLVGYDPKVITTKEAGKIINEITEARFQNWAEKENWINERYKASDILSEDIDPEEIENDWYDECYEWAKSDFEEDWEECLLEIDDDDELRG